MAYNKHSHQDKKTGFNEGKTSFREAGGQAAGSRRASSRRKGSRGASFPGTGGWAGAGFKGGGSTERAASVLEDLLPRLPDDSRQILDSFDAIVQGVRPLSSRQMLSLLEHIRELSHLLTDQRGGRRVGYLNDTFLLSAYLRYFQWWNLLRLTKLFAGLTASQLDLPDGGVCVDMGSGPLTLPIALWLARPDLRERRLTWYCIDYSQQALALGEELYLAVAARTASLPGSARTGGVQAAEDGVEPWRIVRVKGELGVAIRQKAQLVAAANVFNEVVDGSGKPPEFTARRAADIISHYADSPAQVLVVEPGTPPAARFLTAFRGAMARKGLRIVSPCPAGMEWTGEPGKTGPERTGCACPMDGSRGGKWCHFTFPTETAPAKLQRLSASAGLPKERASLAFVLASSAGGGAAGESDLLPVRIVSEPISLPGGRIGHYGCCRLGLVLVEVPGGRNPDGQKPGRRHGADKLSSERLYSERLAPGKLVLVPPPQNPRLDRKSGAVVVRFS